MYKYIVQFMKFILPILGKAGVRAIVDEAVKFAYADQPKKGYTRFVQKGSGRVADIPTDEVPKFDYDKASYHDVVMVAFDVMGPNASIVHEWLHNQMPKTGDALARGDKDETVVVNLDAWWVANDERYDGSDCDSAVFVPMGKQDEARRLLREHGITL